jgi:Spy/CpxP family protein refolding chaperone
MNRNSTRAAVLAIAMTVPVAMQAQRGMGPRAGQAGGNPVAPLIDMRRELNLTGRQLVQLDSIERALVQRNAVVRGRLRARVDSVRPRARRSSEDEIAAYRAQADSMRALRQVMSRNDSTARVAAMSVLTDSQRVRVRERMAERRGFEAGRRSSMRGPRGIRDARPGTASPRLRGPGGRIGMDARRGGVRGPGVLAPRFDDQRRPVPDDSLAPRRRPLDGVDVRPRLRRGPPDIER